MSFIIVIENGLIGVVIGSPKHKRGIVPKGSFFSEKDSLTMLDKLTVGSKLSGTVMTRKATGHFIKLTIYTNTSICNYVIILQIKAEYIRYRLE
jgi:hypothetical protein